MTINISKNNLPERELVEKYLSGTTHYYTLYPTQSNWEKSKDVNFFIENLDIAIKEDVNFSLYIHFPFCPKQCYFCHCYTVISKNKDHYTEIVQTIIKELKNLSSLIYKKSGKNKIKVADVHFGGGTPTVIPMDLFKLLTDFLHENLDKKVLNEIALEVDPRNEMNEQKLLEYKNFGVNRLSFGVQDFNLDVQKAVNRINSYELLKSLLTEKVRSAFKSINFDFIFGLPKQTEKSIKETREKIIKLNPNRITLLNMDHRPDVYKHQNAYNEQDLPDVYTKVKMYFESVEFLEFNGFKRIGVNHFAKEDDILAQYKNMKKIYRNPNGFSPGWTFNMLAIGPSSTGKLGNYYYQNIYSLDRYKELVNSNQIPITREKILNKDDQLRRKVIMDLLNLEIIDLNKVDFNKYFQQELIQIKEFENQGLLTFDKKQNVYEVTKKGSVFISNIGGIFDNYSKNKYASQREFDDGMRSMDRKTLFANT